MTRRRSFCLLQNALRGESKSSGSFSFSLPLAPSAILVGSSAQLRTVWRPLRLGTVYCFVFLVTLCCYDWPWASYTKSSPTGVTGGLSWGSTPWGASAAPGFDGRFFGHRISTNALQLSPRPRSPDRHGSSDDDFLEDEEPLEIWGDLDDTR